MLCCCPIYSHAAWYDAEFEELKARNFINEVHFQNPDTPILREEICDILISLYKYQNPDSIIEEKANNFTEKRTETSFFVRFLIYDIAI